MHSNQNGRKIIVWPLLACVLMGAAYLLQARRAAGADTGAAVIRGTVYSVDDGTALYGIMVSAKGEGKNSTTYVYTDAKGVYDFPPLPLGAYRVSVGIAWEKTVQLTASGAAQDFKIQLGPGLVNQVTGASLMEVIPGSEADKAHIKHTCIQCHSTTYFFTRAPVSLDRRGPGWGPTVTKMRSVYMAATDPFTNCQNPQCGYYEFYKTLWGPESIQRVREFLTKNITKETIYEYAAKALVRPTGEAARAVFTEWDLPAETNPNVPNVEASGIAGSTEAVADREGNLWYIRGGDAIGKIDPRTGEIQQWKAAEAKGNSLLHDMNIDERGDIWATGSGINAALRLDVRTHQFTKWDMPKGTGKWLHTGDFDKAHNYWITETDGETAGVVKLDPRTGKIDYFPPPRKWSFPYGLVIDQKENVWWVAQQANEIVKIDPKTGKQTEYPVPTPNVLPRRIKVDSKGRLWFTESGVPSAIAMLDPATGKITEYPYDVKNGFPYWITIDKFDKIWFNSVEGEFVGKFDPETKKFTLFLMPPSGGHGLNGDIDSSSNTTAILYGTSDRHAIARMYVRP